MALSVMSHLRFCRATLTRDKVAACDFIVARCDFDAASSESLEAMFFVARCVRVAACDYEVARCDFVARQSRALKSRDKITGVTWH